MIDAKKVRLRSERLWLDTDEYVALEDAIVAAMVEAVNGELDALRRELGLRAETTE